MKKPNTRVPRLVCANLWLTRRIQKKKRLKELSAVSEYGCGAVFMIDRGDAGKNGSALSYSGMGLVNFTRH